MTVADASTTAILPMLPVAAAAFLPTLPVAAATIHVVCLLLLLLLFCPSWLLLLSICSFKPGNEGARVALSVFSKAGFSHRNT